MHKIIIVVTIVMLLASNTLAIEKAGGITDREIIESLAAIRGDIKALSAEVRATNQRIDGLEKSINQRIDTLQTFMLWGFGILFGGMGILIGFVIWDRRTALAPAIAKNRELEERGEKVEKALKEYAKVEPRLGEILKSLKLM